MCYWDRLLHLNYNGFLWLSVFRCAYLFCQCYQVDCFLMPEEMNCNHQRVFCRLCSRNLPYLLLERWQHKPYSIDFSSVILVPLLVLYSDTKMFIFQHKLCCVPQPSVFVFESSVIVGSISCDTYSFLESVLISLKSD